MLVLRFVRWLTRAACRSGAPRPLWARQRSAGIAAGSFSLLTPERQPDRARHLRGTATRRLALDMARAYHVCPFLSVTFALPCTMTTPRCNSDDRSGFRLAGRRRRIICGGPA